MSKPSKSRMTEDTSANVDTEKHLPCRVAWLRPVGSQPSPLRPIRDSKGTDSEKSWLAEQPAHRVRVDGYWVDSGFKKMIQDHQALIEKFPHRVQKACQREFDRPFDPEK